jgi:hypothetical protein
MKKSVWGPCIWNVLHTLSIKIKDSHFDSQRTRIIEIIQKICNNLPCPICSSHASNFLRKNRFSQLKSKDQLIRFMWMLHNDVNKRLKKQSVDYDTLLSTYESMDFKEVLTKYYTSLSNMNFGEKMMLYSFHRKLFLKSFLNYFKTNIKSFEN